ncbi:ERAD-associated protein, partial [Quaeritorhiza haematococci]
MRGIYSFLTTDDESAKIYRTAIQILQSISPESASSSEKTSSGSGSFWDDRRTTAARPTDPSSSPEFDPLMELFRTFFRLVRKYVLPRALTRRITMTVVVDKSETFAAEMEECEDSLKSEFSSFTSLSLRNNENGSPRPAVPVVEESDPASVKRRKAMRMLYVAGYAMRNPDAVYTLGDMWLYSTYGHPRNATHALHHYSTLAHQHANATAQRLVGIMYATGIGVPRRDHAKALLYLSFAAAGHDTIAEQTMGYWHMAGIGTHKNCEESAFYYKRVADK